MKLNFNATKGFTLIELIVVITIIGILSAIALAKFINIQTEARIAKAQGIFGTIRIAADLAKSVCILDLAGLVTPSTCTATGGTVNMDGTLVDMVNQYPDATVAGIINATQLIPSSDNVTVTPGSPLTIGINGAPTIANCQIAYTAAVLGAAPVVTLVTTGC